MSCTHPIRAFPTGDKTEKGKDEYFFSFTDDTVIPAWQVEKRFKKPWFRDLHAFIELPCGKCFECRKSYAWRWSVRCACEALEHEQNYFVTLTYNTTSGNLTKSDLQNFFKRLRRHGYNFRYFACGEYGEQRHRPHYHVLFFGLDLKDRLVPWSQSGKFRTYRSPDLEALWYHGFVLVGYADSAAVGGYVAKYCMKSDPFFKEPEDAPSFLLMSRKPGIGFNAFHKFMDGYGSIVVPSGRGKALKSSIPKSYRERENIPQDPKKVEAVYAKLSNQMIAAGYTPEQVKEFFNVEKHREDQEYLDELGHFRKY